MSAALELRTWLSLSNLAALFPLERAVELYGLASSHSLVVILSAVSSMLMHMSETKHDIEPGPILRHFSSTFLNIDRFFATSAMCFFINLVKNHIFSLLPMDMYIVLLASMICGYLGEHTSNLRLYGAAHTVWHFGAYYLMYRAFNVTAK